MREERRRGERTEERGGLAGERREERGGEERGGLAGERVCVWCVVCGMRGAFRVHLSSFCYCVYSLTHAVHFIPSSFN